MAVSAAPLSERGFNDKIKWTNNLEEAKVLAAKENKPVFVLIHKTWCGACKRLKTQFAEAGNDLIAKSEKFIMVNLEDDEEPKDSAYAPDGGYIPRIVYLNKQGEVQSKVINEARKGGQYQYYYSDISQVVKGMDNALASL